MARWLGSKEAVGGDYPSSSRSRRFHLAEEALDLLTRDYPTKKSALITEPFLKRSGKGGAVVQNEKAQQFFAGSCRFHCAGAFIVEKAGETNQGALIITIVADALPNRLLYDVAI